MTKYHFAFRAFFITISSQTHSDIAQENGLKKVLDEYLIYEILSVVGEVPEGKVATYGQIARLINRSKNSRLVGKVLSRAQDYGDYPCHRIVNHCGRLVPGWDEQRYLLAAEGVLLKDDFHVDLKKYQWDC